MRGRVDGQGGMFYVMDVEELVPAEHPLRAIKPRVDGELKRLRPFVNKASAQGGRPSIPRSLPTAMHESALELEAAQSVVDSNCVLSERFEKNVHTTGLTP